MSSLTVTAATAVARVAYLADLEGQTATGGRHDQLLAEVNQAQREMRELLVQAGWRFYTRQVDLLTSMGTLALANCAVATLQGDVAYVWGLDMRITGLNGQQYVFTLARGGIGAHNRVNLAADPAHDPDAWRPRSNDPEERPEGLPEWDVLALDGGASVNDNFTDEFDGRLVIYPCSAARLDAGNPTFTALVLPQYSDALTTDFLRYPSTAAYTFVVATAAYRAVALRDGSTSARAQGLAQLAQQARQDLQAGPARGLHVRGLTSQKVYRRGR